MGSKFCKYCESILMPNQKRCGACGKVIEDTGNIFSRFERKATVPEQEIEIVENKDAPYMPYSPRELQMDIIMDIKKALDGGRHIVIESGTGTGKTIVSLAGGLEHAKQHGKKVVYLTRTISQSDQVMKELRAISRIKPISGITITGRNKSCPLFKAEDVDVPPNVLSLMCEERKGRSQRGSSGGCRYFDRTKVVLESIASFSKENFPTSEELDKYCEGLGACPYEAKKLLMREFDVVTAPYIHILSEDIRSNFITNLGGEDIPLLMIIDEAHNIVDAAREQESFRITARTIDTAIDECSTMSTQWVSEGIKAEDIIKNIRSTVKSIATEKIGLGKTEYRLPKDAIESPLISKFNFEKKDLEHIADAIISLGERRMDALLDKGDNTVSELYELGIALKNWMVSDDGKYVKALKLSDDGEYLSAACIDPSDIVTFMRSLKGAVHMSGTLQPLDQYHKIMGLPRETIARTYPSPFPKENRSVIYVSDVTTRYDDMNRDPSMITRIEKKIAKLCWNVNKNTLVFFPSYKMMKNMRPFLERDIDKPLYWEESGHQKKTMRALDEFRKGVNGVFFSVMGGSIAEGIDFPGDELCFAIIVGIPFPPPSLEQKAMSEMFDIKYGEGLGWKYTSETPAIRKMRQAIGRLIRNETDRGMAVILDSRASKYQRQLEASLSQDPIADAVMFFEKDSNP